MLLALAAAVLSVGLGAAVAIAGGGRTEWLGPTRTFAMVTAVAVVVAQLLPEALRALGLVALGLLALGLLVPLVFEQLATTRRDVVGLELGYLGLVLHKIGDGLALGTFTSDLHEGHGHGDLVVAIAAHTVPVVALVTLVFLARRGVRTAIVRAVVLAAAAAVGILLTRVVPTASLSTAEPYITAAVAGMLLHVVFHDWKLVRGEGSVGLRRVGDAVALAMGASILFAGEHAHHGEGTGRDVRALAGRAMLDLLLETAPWLLLGLLLAATLQTLSSRRAAGWALGGSPSRGAWLGALAGGATPVSVCAVLPVAHSLRVRGGGVALVTAFLLATPGLGLETFVLTVHFLGWPFALARLAATVALALVGALLLARLARLVAEPRHTTAVTLGPALEDPGGGVPARFAAHLGELLHHVGPWTVLSLVVAAFVHAVLEPSALAPLAGTGLDVLIITVLAAPSYLCAAAATPFAAVLLAKGLSPAAVLVGLLLGSLLNVATIGYLRAAYGTRGAVVALGGVVVLAVAASFGFEALGVESAPHELGDARTDRHGLASWAATAALGLLVLGSIWRSGLRRWLGGLGEAWSAEEHRHNHGHAEGDGVTRS